jgi:hypothetical protein
MRTLVRTPDGSGRAGAPEVRLRAAPPGGGDRGRAVLLALTAVGAAFVSLTALLSDVLLALLDPPVR